jgi:hypothetical protein
VVEADPLLSAAGDLRDALVELNEWVNAWDPNFIHDDEWPATRDKIAAALAKSRGRN